MCPPRPMQLLGRLERLAAGAGDDAHRRMRVCIWESAGSVSCSSSINQMLISLVRARAGRIHPKPKITGIRPGSGLLPAARTPPPGPIQGPRTHPGSDEIVSCRRVTLFFLSGSAQLIGTYARTIDLLQLIQYIISHRLNI